MNKTNDKRTFDPSTISQMANAKSQGKRPDYFSDPMAEHSFSITMALMAELAVARERIDTLERVLEAKGLLSKDDIDTYIPDQEAAQTRQLAQAEYSARVLRSLQQEVEAMSGNNKSMDEMAAELGKPNA